MKTKKGFTLIELMIVVAIIGILAAIAIPKFADLIRKSKEGATKGSLGALRSALTIYYGEQEGVYPSTTVVAGTADEVTFTSLSGPFLTKYLDKMPSVKLGITNVNDQSTVRWSANTSGSDIDVGCAWWYKGMVEGAMHVYVVNGASDTKGQSIALW